METIIFLPFFKNSRNYLLCYFYSFNKNHYLWLLKKNIMNKTSSHRLATRLLHDNIERSSFAETCEALFLTSGFIYESAEQAERTFKKEENHYQYSRVNNPTVTNLENRLIQLEEAESCIATSTGMSAIFAALFASLKQGSRIVASKALFGSSYWIIDNFLPKLGIETVFVEGTDLQDWKQALSKHTDIVMIESPSNPMLDILDIQQIANLTHQAGGKLIIDNVFATPLYQKPLKFGADLVVYSCTKHMDGQGRVLGGAILGNKELLETDIIPFVHNTGLTISAFNAWILLKGLETFPLRMEKMTENAKICAEFIEQSKVVNLVRYPGLRSHPQYDLAHEQMDAPSAMIAFEVKGGKEGAFTFMNALQLVLLCNNLGDSRSIVTHPATTTHMKVSPEDRLALGITDGIIRFSVGLEDPKDLLEDLQKGFDALANFLNKKNQE